MSLLERLRRWWQRADYEDDHPLTEEERNARQSLTAQDELGKLAGGTRGGPPPIDPDEELEPPPEW